MAATTTDESGIQRCLATGKRCLSYRQVSELVRRAKRRGERGQRQRCATCGSWHYSGTPVAGRKARGRKRGQRF